VVVGHGDLSGPARLEAVIDASGVAERLEALLPSGGRPRQLRVATLLLGLVLALRDGRPGHLVRAHRALVSLGDVDRRRLGVEVHWPAGPHLLTYRQVERTFALLRDAVALPSADGRPSSLCQEVTNALLEASVPDAVAQRSTSLAVDWTDLETFARAPRGDRASADPDASWGRRAGSSPGVTHELFFGYELQLAAVVNDEGGPPVPELCRRALVTSCHLDPVPEMAKVLAAMPDSGVALGDVLCDSGYAHRAAERWALPVRAAGGELVMDLHPHDRGTQGTHQGAVICNGQLYCPMTPAALLALAPLARGADRETVAAHDERAAELDRYRFGVVSRADADGYRRLGCPATLGKLRCPARPASLTLPYDKPAVLSTPEHLPQCCTQATITVAPSVAAKTRQKHPYPSKAHRRSYARRTAVERANATIKDPASNDIAKGWCRVMGLAAISIVVACLLVARNDRVLAAFTEREADVEHRQRVGKPPPRRRRRTFADLLDQPP
jgi:hypothetical protein